MAAHRNQTGTVADMNAETLVSAIAATLTTVAFVPQAIHVLRHKETAANSLGKYVTFATGVIFWLLFGAIIGNAPIIIANIITFGLAVSIILMKLRYG